MKQKKILASALLLLLTGGVNAQELSSYHFIEAQGGLQFTSTNAKITKLLNPTYSLSYGYMTPTVGGRLNVNGLESKGRFESLGQDYKWKYYTADLDLLLNLTNIFSKDYSHALNVMFVGGVGLTHTWNHEGQDQASVKRDLFHNLRAGLRLETNVTKPLGVSLEIDANNTSDFYNGKVNNSDDWGFSAMLGVSYRFGQKYQAKKAELKSPETNAIAMADVEIGNYQMMTTKLNSEMELWEKRMPNESLEAYQTRVNPTTRAAKRQALEYEISTQMATNQLATTNARLGRYDRNTKKAAVKVGSMPEIYLDMEESEVNGLYNKDLKLKNAKYRVKKDNSFELVYAEVENPMTGKTYVYDINKPSKPAKPAVVEQKKPEPQQPKTDAQAVAKKADKITENVFFDLSKSDIKADQASKIDEIVTWANENPKATILLKGYADKETGTPQVNKQIAKQRTEAVKKALRAKGIAAKRIKVEVKGDTEQPFANNDDNRVVIILSEE